MKPVDEISDSVDAVVVGAGVVGLAIGRALARSGRSVIVIEKNRHVGEETSSRNSGVIHSGIYYPTGSLKAQLCVRGRELLYAYCEEKGIAHLRCGKVIVAQEAELASLVRLHETAGRNGVDDLERLDSAGARILEPQVRCAGGLWCPGTGIVDVHELMTALQGDLEATDGNVVFETELRGARPTSKRWLLSLAAGGNAMTLSCSLLVNAAGLHAVELLERIEGYARDRIPRHYLARGNYFALRGRAPFQHLVYPMPVPGGLGIHATLDLGGRVRFGPDVEWVDSLDYAVDPARGERFYAAIRSYWPALPDRALEPAYAGIRTKLAGPGEPAADFVIECLREPDAPGLINLLGIESPGLTASLAVAERVVAQSGPQVS